ncbi:MAG TPA: hypothetical protein VHO07_24120 [Streptosporangiaceae bacterium]|nr:hypothetical protein [Streptosporangiaceae bacterium]
MRRNPDIVMAGLHDDERRGEGTKVNLRDLVGDRSLPAGAGPHVACPWIAVDNGVPVQPAGQQESP